MNKIKLLLMAAILVMGNMEMNAAWSGSGNGTLQNGVYYSVYDDNTYTDCILGTTLHTFTLSAPASGTCSYSYKKYSLLSTNTNVSIQNQDGTSLSSFKCSNYKNWTDATFGITTAVTSVKFQLTGSGDGAQIRYVHIPMAQYMEDASKSSLNFGNKKVQDAAVSDNFTIAHCNIPAMTYTINNNGGDADAIQDVEVSITDNSQAGYYSTATITVKYTPTHVGTLKANLVITSSGFGSKTIALNGSCSKHDQTVTWTTDSISPLNIGTELDSIATAELDLTFTSSNSTIVNIDENGKFIAVAAGTAIITASNEGSDYYNPVSSTMEITVNEETATALEATTDDQQTATKFFREGQLYIRRGNRVYDTKGQLVQ